jgi:hypothetical protein
MGAIFGQHHCGCCRILGHKIWFRLYFKSYFKKSTNKSLLLPPKRDRTFENFSEEFIERPKMFFLHHRPLFCIPAITLMIERPVVCVIGDVRALLK